MTTAYRNGLFRIDQNYRLFIEAADRVELTGRSTQSVACCDRKGL